MTIPENAQAAIDEELKILAHVKQSLALQHRNKLERLYAENARARELTSEYVRTRRVEDKALLASDEAVAHGLKDRQKADVQAIEKLMKRPYFARMVLKETAGAAERDIEYKIGLLENSECRIIDWRKAPIAKLYYEYKEGEEYCEEIQGKERCGTIALRNTIEIENGVLTRLSCRHGSFVQLGEKWQAASDGPHPHDQRQEPGAASRAFLLPQIVSLLDPEQFRLISESPHKAILLQGVAGSGKTTVALHRLAWLFADPETKLTTDNCLVLVLSPALKTYISRTLPEMSIEGVRVVTLREWMAEVISSFAPQLCRENYDGAPALRRPETPTPAGVDRLKRSMAMLRRIEQDIRTPGPNRRLDSSGIQDLIAVVLQNPRQIMECDESKLIDSAAISAAYQRTRSNQQAVVLDACDDALFVRASQLIQGGVPFKNGSIGKYEHILADEVQDYSPIELACVLGGISGPEHVTLVGDTDQKIDPGSVFPGWDKLQKHWNLKESFSKFIRLNLSYRCTIEIQRLADYIQKRTAGCPEGRHGRKPIWFKCLSEARGIEAAKNWLTQAVQRYPNSLSAVICPDPAQAKQALNYLKPAFGPAIRAGDDSAFSFEGGIVVSHISQVRGLEFSNVLIWNPSKKEFPADQAHRNLLYLAISRARENLCLVTWGRASELLPGFNSPLIRGYDLENEELYGGSGLGR